MQLKKRYYEKEKIDSEFGCSMFDETSFAYSFKHLQTVFYLLLMRYVLARACFVIEVLWHLYTSKRRETKRTLLSQADINSQLRSLPERNLPL
jgi:hypothetical protein